MKDKRIKFIISLANDVYGGIGDSDKELIRENYGDESDSEILRLAIAIRFGEIKKWDFINKNL